MDSRLLAPFLMMFSILCFAKQPDISFSPLTPVAFTMNKSDVDIVSYAIMNNTNSIKKLNVTLVKGMKSLQGHGYCGNGMVLVSKKGCMLSLRLIGKEMTGDVRHMPFLCAPDLSRCYFPEPKDQMDIKLKEKTNG